MNIRQIVSEWLKEHDYDGLCNRCEECGCGLDDLMPCGEPHETDCVAAYKCPQRDFGEGDEIYFSRPGAKETSDAGH